MFNLPTNHFKIFSKLISCINNAPNKDNKLHFAVISANGIKMLVGIIHPSQVAITSTLITLPLKTGRWKCDQIL